MRFNLYTVKNYERVEEDFFDIDEDAGEARIVLRFASPEDIFNTNCLSNTPIFSDEFKDWLRASFEIIPSKYQIALDISFDDPGEYTEEELQDIFRKNLLLTAKSHFQAVRSRFHIAYGLIAAGLVSFIIMMLFGRLWGDGSFWQEIVFYLLDIVTTAFLWEAASILLVETREDLALLKGYRERFSSIVFHC